MSLTDNDICKEELLLRIDNIKDNIERCVKLKSYTFINEEQSKSLDGVIRYCEQELLTLTSKVQTIY